MPVQISIRPRSIDQHAPTRWQRKDFTVRVCHDKAAAENCKDCLLVCGRGPTARYWRRITTQRQGRISCTHKHTAGRPSRIGTVMSRCPLAVGEQWVAGVHMCFRGDSPSRGAQGIVSAELVAFVKSSWLMKLRKLYLVRHHSL